jgi:hypothetical protein
MWAFPRCRGGVDEWLTGATQVEMPVRGSIGESGGRIIGVVPKGA